jgi:hypothetical protein
MTAPRLEPCRSGLHLCRPEDLPYWLCEELYAVEVDGDVVPHQSFVLARRARLSERVDAWAQATAAAFCLDCAERVRDLAVEALEAAHRPADAHRLASCDTTEEVRAVAGGILGSGDAVSPLVGYAMDAATFAAAAGTRRRWPADTATTAFVSAKAAAVRADGSAAGGSAARDAATAERHRQGAWLSSHLLVSL